MRRKEIVAMLLAGGQGSRLGSLTRRIAKPAVSFGGKYRIIDFSLSNCVNSRIDTVGVLTQYKPFLLNSYIGIGRAWDLDNAYGGVHILPPFMEEGGGNWYKGTANAVYHNMDFIDHYSPDYVLIISGDHIYRMDYTLMLDFHKSTGADLTISVIEVPWEETSRFGIMTCDAGGRITRFREKPKDADSNLASMGIYIFDWPVLRQALIEDEADPQSEHDFGKNVIPMLLDQGKKLYAYRFQGYWRDVGTIDSYYEANMDLLSKKPQLDIYDNSLRIFSNSDVLAPHYLGPRAKITNSLVSNGCIILGEVVNSILAPGVLVGEGAKVLDSIVLPHGVIGEGAALKTAIVGENVQVPPGRCIGLEHASKTNQRVITVIDDRLLAKNGVRQEALA